MVSVRDTGRLLGVVCQCVDGRDASATRSVDLTCMTVSDTLPVCLYFFPQVFCPSAHCTLLPKHRKFAAGAMRTSMQSDARARQADCSSSADHELVRHGVLRRRHAHVAVEPTAHRRCQPHRQPARWELGLHILSRPRVFAYVQSDMGRGQGPRCKQSIRLDNHELEPTERHCR